MEPLKLNISRVAKKGIINMEPYIPGRSIQEIQQKFGLEKVEK